MHVTIDEFWRLAEASELLSAGDCARLHAEFSRLKGAAGQANAQSLAEWLAAQGTLTRYQAAQLAAGRPGPFVFGPFVIAERISDGTTRLFRARRQNEPDVLLAFLPHLTDAPGRYPDLVARAQAAAAVKSPHVSRTLGAARHRGQTFLVAESLPGQRLDSWVAGRALDVRTACRLGFQLALGLVAVHQQKQVHGRVCPRHAWMVDEQRVKLLQFPLAGADPKDRHEEPMIDYLAPELIAGQAADSALGDVYALGCVLYELIAGRAVFPGGSTRQKLARHQSELPQRLDRLDPQVPEELAELIAEMLAKDPLLRCQSADQAAYLLAPHASEGGPRAGHPPRAGATGPAPGYGAWQAPAWQAPPPQTRPATDPPPVVRPAAAVSATAPLSAALDPFAAPHADDATAARKRQTSSMALFLGLAVGSAMVLGVLVAALMANRTHSRGEPAGAPAPEAPAPLDASLAPATAAPATPPAHDEERALDDDTSLLWESPTSGPPVDLRWVPSGAQVVFVVRLAELLAAPEGLKAVDALGPAGAAWQQMLRGTLGVEPAAVERLVVAFVPDDATQPQAGYVVRLARDVPQSELLTSWGNPAGAKHARASYFQRADRGYYLPPGDPRTVVIAPVAVLRGILEADGRPLLRGAMERLAARSDAQRQVNLFFTPSYLLTDGASLLGGPLAALRLPLRQFLDPSIEAVLLSAHLGEALFVECRTASPIDTPPLAQLAVLRQRWDDVPGRVEAHVGSLEPQPYGRELIERFPQMLRLARDYTRGGVEDGQVVLRAYLPASAAHNLVLGAELTLLETAGVAEPAEATATADEPAVAEALRRTISLSFGRESLEAALALLAQELGVEIVILGSDLQAEGITKNQALDQVDERDQPAAAILHKLLQRANPDGKLVYVVKPHGEHGQAIFITTRRAATQRGDTLPPGF